MLRSFSPYVAIVVIGLVSGLLLSRWSSYEHGMALANFRAASLDRAQAAAKHVESSLTQIYQNIRTISMLPGVIKIDRHGSNLDSDAKLSIQQIYNNLMSNVAVSEVYIVPADFRPDEIDPVTGKPQEPILMFDELITRFGKSRPEGSVPEDAHEEHEPEVEIHEYRQLQEQATWLAQHYPNAAAISGLDVPMISGSEVITCDNTEFNATKSDADRSGVMFSVPFFGADGAFKGTITAIIRTNALRNLLPAQDAALVNTLHKYSVPSTESGQQTLSKSMVENGEADPGLLFSAVLPLSLQDPMSRWQVWVGHPNSDFLQGHVVRAIEMYRRSGYAVIACLAFMGLVLCHLLRRRREQELARLNQELAENLVKLEAASEAKSRFLAVMSHEMRTPLNGIIGMSNILGKTRLTARQKELLQPLSRSASNLLLIINDVLDLSRIESGKLELQSARFSPRDCVAGTIEMFTELARDKALGLELHCAASVPDAVEGDEVRLRQICVNLIGNALKFTRKGSITLRMSAQAAGSGHARIFLSCADTGIGIEPEALKTLFQPFTQADSSISRRFGGTGLGLSITRRLVEMMGGEVKISSAPGLGTDVQLSVLLQVPAQTPASESEASDRGEPVQAASTSGGTPAQGPPHAISAHILVAEDNPVNVEVIRWYLSDLGCTCSITGNGQEAIEALAKETFDLVLMDAQMPELDGLSATQRIRADESRSGAPRIPIVSVTANAFESDRLAALEAGSDDFLSKPFEEKQLAAVLAKWLPGRVLLRAAGEMKAAIVAPPKRKAPARPRKKRAGAA